MKFFRCQINTENGRESINDNQELHIDNATNSLVIFKENHYYSSWRSGADAHYSAFVLAHDIYMTAEDAGQRAEALFNEKITPLGRLIRVEEVAFRDIDGGLFCGTRDTPRNLIAQFKLMKDARSFNALPQAFSVSKLEALKASKCTWYSSSLAPEISRIFQQATPDPIVRKVPVHYFFENARQDHFEPAFQTLLNALKSTSRTMTNSIYHFCVDDTQSEYIDMFGSVSVDKFVTHKLAETLNGSTLVVEYGRNDTGVTYNLGAFACFKRLLEVLTPYLPTTQIIFVVPPNNRELRQRIRRLVNYPIIDIFYDKNPSFQKAEKSKVRSFLIKKCEEAHVEPNKLLFEMLDEYSLNKSHDDPEKFFADWLIRNNLTTACPQYHEAAQEALDLREDSTVSKTALEQLDDLIGLSEPKQLIKDVIARARMNKKLAERGLPEQPFSLHLAFLGEPGTGKTEVAKLYGEILKEEGLLSEGRVITVSGSKMKQEDIEKALGSVLFIDEAYALLSNPFDVTDLVASMERYRDNLVVIFAGYKDHMNALFDFNPGFRSRLGFIIEFPNYTADELLRIFTFMVNKNRLEITAEATCEVEAHFARVGKRGDQGNARYVRKTFEDIVGNQQKRLARKEPKGGYTLQNLVTILPEDVANLKKKAVGKSGRELLADLIGLEGIKRVVTQRLDYAIVQKMKRDEKLPSGNLPLHMAFKGNPGTGKTEVARIIGKILKEEGILSVGDFYECGRQDLISPVVGATAIKIKTLFEKARGSVIFIDEAYSLIDNTGYGDEAITTIIDQMEKLRDEVVVIFAGYTDEIDALFAKNPGFLSRVATHIEFPDYSTEELCDIFAAMAKSQKLRCSEKTRTKIRHILEAAGKATNFGNARYVRNLLDNALLAQSSRLSNMRKEGGNLSAKDLTTLVEEDFNDEPPTQQQRRLIGFVNS